MKKTAIIAIFAVCLIIACSVDAFADLEKLAHMRRNANRRTFFNDVTDFLATLGKSEQETKLIKMSRRAKRRKRRLDQAKKQYQAEVDKDWKRYQKKQMEKIEARSQRLNLSR